MNEDVDALQRIQRTGAALPAARPGLFPARRPAAAHLRTAIPADGRGRPGRRPADRPGPSEAWLGRELRRPAGRPLGRVSGPGDRRPSPAGWALQPVLRGIARVRIRDEPPTDKLFRSARVEVLRDIVPDDVEELMALAHRLGRPDPPARDRRPGPRAAPQPLPRRAAARATCATCSRSLCRCRRRSSRSCSKLFVVTDRARELMEAFRAVVGGATTAGRGPDRGGGSRRTSVRTD